MRAALAAPTSVSTWPAAIQLGLVVDYRIEYLESATCETVELLRRVERLSLPHLQLMIERLAIQLAPPTPPRRAEPSEANLQALVSRGRALGRVLRELLLRKDGPHVHTVALMWCSYSDYRLVGAALSAVALASSLIEALRCSGLVDGSQPQERLLRLAWFGYALHCHCRWSRVVPWSLSLLSHDIVITDAESEYIMALLAHGTPLRDVGGEALLLCCGGHDDRMARLTVECHPLGTRVPLANGTSLYYELFRSDDACVAATIVQDKDDDGEDVELELVAHAADHGGFVAVVYAGYGLVWANAACVVAWQRGHDGDDDMAMADVNETLSCGSPSESKTSALRVAALLPLLQQSATRLKRLTLDRCVITHDDLSHVLAYYPYLESLTLDRCVAESLIPLVDAFTAQRLERLAVLSLRVRQRGDAPPWIVPFLVDTLLTRGVAREVLRELHVDLRALASEGDVVMLVARLAQAVASSALPLRRLHITCCGQQAAACFALLGPLRVVALVNSPLRVRCAVLCVLHAWHCAVRGVAQTVLAMAEARVLRAITLNLVEI